MQCIFIKSNGEQCKAHTIPLSIYCWAHRNTEYPLKISRKQLFSLIIANNGPEGLDLSGKDLEGIDLSSDILREELQLEGCLENPPIWIFPPTCGINLVDSNLENATINNSYLWRGNFSNSILKGAQLKYCDLGEAILEGVDLTKTNLEGANLHDVNINGAILNETNLTDAELDGIDFTKVAYFENVYLCGAHLENTKILRYQLEGSIGEEIDRNFLKAKEAYLSVKNNYTDTGRYNDAGWAYIKERKMERESHNPHNALRLHGDKEGILESDKITIKKIVFYIRHLIYYITHWLIQVTTGYGEKPGLILLWGLFILLLFPFLYCRTKSLSIINNERSITLLDIYNYSFAAFATMNLHDIVPVNNTGKLLTNLEAALGITIFALLMWSLGNRVSRSS